MKEDVEGRFAGPPQFGGGGLVIDKHPFEVKHHLIQLGIFEGKVPVGPGDVDELELALEGCIPRFFNPSAEQFEAIDLEGLQQIFFVLEVLL